MKKLIIVAAVAGIAFLGWKYWNSVKQENAQAWAASTDPVD